MCLTYPHKLIQDFFLFTFEYGQKFTQTRDKTWCFVLVVSYLTDTETKCVQKKQECEDLKTTYTGKYCKTSRLCGKQLRKKHNKGHFESFIMIVR